MESTTHRQTFPTWRSVKRAVLNLIGRTMDATHRPARIREFEYVDPISDQTVYLSTGSRYSVLHIGNLKLFFDRATGRFDGTCRSLEERVEDGLKLLD
jgi:hypothetical protein